MTAKLKKNRLEEIRAKSKQVIMEAALELFATKGFHNTTISQIATSAGISKGLMYNYFNSKNDLLEAILLSAYEEGSEIITKELELPDTPKEHLKHIIEKTSFILKNQLKHWKLLTALSFQEDAKKFINSDLLPNSSIFIQQFAALFKEIGYENPTEEALIFQAVLDGIGLSYITMESAYPLDDVIKVLINKYCI